MMTKSIYLLIISLLVCSTTSVNAAKEAKAKLYLDRFSQMVVQNGGVSIGFTLIVTHKNNVIQTSSGNLRMSGSQYYMQSSGMQIWYDGATQWSYLESTNEVNISTPTKEQAQMINPLMLARSYEKGFDYYTLPIRSVNQRPCVAVELTPLTKNELTRIVLYMEPKSCEPLLLELYTQNKEIKTQILITAFKNQLTMPKEQFIFQMSKFPKVEIIDLR